MISRALIPFLLLILLPDVYLCFRFLRHSRWWKQVLWFIPALLMVVFTVYLARQQGFLPSNPEILYLYLFLLGLLVIPKALFSLFSIGGLLLGRCFRRDILRWRRWGERMGVAAVVFSLYVLIYGSFWGFEKMEVRHVDIEFADLPPAFDGYRITLFSDLHVGTYTGKRRAILERAVDSINAQKADLIAFAGDMQNALPEEIDPFIDLLSKLKAKDGVFAARGNHDFSVYSGIKNYVTRAENEELTLGKEMDMGWKVLVNGRRFVHRGRDSIVVCGLDNDGEGRFPGKGNIQDALWGVNRQQFVVMLEHDPTAWRRKILRKSHVQLTLSGHTHAMQFSLFGWSPAAFLYREYEGLYKAGDRRLYVTKGLGGVIPFRFGATGEIVVITLKRKK